MQSFSLFRTIILIAALLLPVSLRAANLPLTDLIFYGRVYQKVSHAPVTGTLPAPITVTTTWATDPPGAPPRPTVIATTAELLDGGTGTKQYYVLRIKRFEIGTARRADDAFVLPGDRIHIFLNGTEEVAETEVPKVVANEAVQDVRMLALNAPPNPDSDGDGLPDSWEQTFFGSLAQPASGDSNKDGVTNHLAYALGLNPLQNNASKLPFVLTEANGDLTLYFRQAAPATGLLYRIESASDLSASSWNLVTGVVPQYIATEGSSLIYKAVLPGGRTAPRKFYRLNVVP